MLRELCVYRKASMGRRRCRGLLAVFVLVDRPLRRMCP